ncbi:MAG: hypothetical protein JWP48_4022, partial [Actinoallomurus sp.]|nr:hypothetical protein [Actinoallomurus sp.]
DRKIADGLDALFKAAQPADDHDGKPGAGG